MPLHDMNRKSWIAGAATALLCLAGAASAQTDPLNVQVVGHWDDHPADYTAADLWADDRGYAYLGNASGATVDIMDIRDPAHPSLVTTYLVPAPNDFANTKDVKEANGLLFVSLDDDGGDGLQVVDVRDPADPVLLVNVTVPGFEDVHNSFYDGGFLYLAGGVDAYIAVVDLRQFDPDDPPAETITESRWLVGPVGAHLVSDITVVGDRLYVAAWDSGVWIYDVGDVANQAPTPIAWAAGNHTNSVWPAGDGRWIITNEKRDDGGPVKLYELIERSGIVTLAHRSTFTIPIEQAPSSHNVYVVGLRVYCAWYNRGLMVLDINTQSTALELVAHYDTSTSPTSFDGAWGVYPFLGADRVLVSDTDTQLWVFDVRVPSPGDADGDGDSDLADFAELQACFSGDGVPHATPECDALDLDNDDDVDLDDYHLFNEQHDSPIQGG